MHAPIPVDGESIGLKTTDLRHFGVAAKKAPPGDFMQAFSNAVISAVEDTNDLQVTSDRLAMQMMRKPDSVDVHEVMIAAQKAQLSLDLTRGVLQRAIQAYQNISNLR